MFNTSIIQDTDSYKFSHYKQYRPNTTVNYSYFESRGGDYKFILFYGLQYYLKEYLSRQITAQDVYDAKLLAEAHGEPFNFEGWSRIINEHNGYLPVRIKAVAEGTIVPTGNVLMTIENTDPQLAWLTSYIETMLSRVWYTCTVATRSWECRRIIKKNLDKTSDDPENEIMFKLHDFGSRGSTSQESAALGGSAHLLSFFGTDTVVAIPFLKKYYNAEEMPGFSIPAAEHSTMTPWGRDGEYDGFLNMIRQYGDGMAFAVVSDSYDIDHAVEHVWGELLRKEVEAMKAMLVVRPDSGDPVEVPFRIVQKLDAKFGHTVNKKGYKVLNNVRVIQGDGMNQDQIEKLYAKLEANGYAGDNMAVGMGAGLLQKLDRDTCKFAYKTSYMEIDGKGVDIFKDPITDPGKKSKKGKLSLVDNNGQLTTVPQQEYGDLLQTVWENGKLLVDHTLDEIRDRSRQEMVRI